LGVRVKLRIKIGKVDVETSALVNTGFETSEPQLLVPFSLLTSMGIDLRDLGKPEIITYGTAGGDVNLYVFRKGCRVSVIEPDKSSPTVESDLVLSHVENEVLISDALCEELGIIILNPRKGYWRFIDDPPDRVRRSYPQKLW